MLCHQKSSLLMEQSTYSDNSVAQCNGHCRSHYTVPYLVSSTIQHTTLSFYCHLYCAVKLLSTHTVILLTHISATVVYLHYSGFSFAHYTVLFDYILFTVIILRTLWSVLQHCHYSGQFTALSDVSVTTVASTVHCVVTLCCTVI